MATIRITKAMRYTDIKALLTGNVPEHSTSVEDAVAFINNELAMLTKKNSGERKPTSKQIANKDYTEKLVAFLMEQAGPVNCGDIQRGIPEFGDFQNQKIASLLKPLIAEGKVVRSSNHGRSVFAMV